MQRLNIRQYIKKYREDNKDKKIHIIERGPTGANGKLWEFRLKRYGIPVYSKDVSHFMLIGWLLRENCLPDHAWLIPKYQVCNKDSIYITNKTKYLLKFREFEITDILFNKTIEYDEKDTLKHYKTLAKKDGFDNIKDWDKWKSEISSNSLPENKYCSTYLGKIGENISDPILIELFRGIERKIPLHGGRYDRIVNGGHKIDIKVRCLRTKDNGWTGWEFEIDHNDKTDYFLLIGIDNETDNNLMHIWLFYKNDIIRDYKFHNRTSFGITNKSRYLLDLQRYEITDKLKDIKEYRKKFKEYNRKEK